jgi:hypothetical protein
MELTPNQVRNIIQQVYDMREAQRNYFEHRTDGNLRLSIRKEKTVDDSLNYLIKHNYITKKQLPTPAPELFGKK